MHCDQNSPMMTAERLLVSTLLAMLTFASAPGWSAPAPWYWWYSRLDGQRHCAQFSPGPGWEQGPGPFRDLNCSIAHPTAQSPGRPVVDPGQPDSRSTGKLRPGDLD